MNTNKKPAIVVIGGATGSGKTNVAIWLARQPDLPEIEIISADSRQIYRHLDIGTDKVSQDIRKEIPHHMIDIVEPDTRYSAAEFARDASQIIREITARGHLPLVAGGTGLYIRILTGGLADVTGPDASRRKHYQEQLLKEGHDSLHTLLASRDPARAAKLAPADSFRVIRALEILDSGITGIDETYAKHQFREKPFHTLKLILTMNRDFLYKRIDQRVDEMIDRGFLREVKELLLRFKADDPALEAIGYRQIIQHIQGNMTLEEAIRIIKRNSRRYSKRQLTWFRREPEVNWIEYSPGQPDSILDNVKQQIRRFYESWANR
ncbi:tRNA (adenosine(37)-N6)-dimethylallyltransferase MiaA [bacterium]|nr:tRNA (adenosine(37)-N6)-dimethylallyltransferase MiaA [bacterium]